MNNHFKFLVFLVITALSFTSCNDDSDSSNLILGMALSEFSATTYPLTDDLWTISATTATASEYAGLIAALKDVSYNDSERKISLYFPYLQSIADGAFLLSTSDSSISLNSLFAIYATTAKKIGSSAFEGCNMLQTVDFPSATTILDSAFEDCFSLESASFGSVNSVGNAAFKRCNTLTSIELHQAADIDSDAFAYCSSLQSVDLSSLTTVNSSTFYGCSALVEIELPKATTLGVDAFSSCTSLQSVIAPAAISIVESFFWCTALISLEIATDSGTFITDFTNPFYGVATENITLTLGSDSYDKYVFKENLFIFSDNTIFEFASIILD